MQILLWELAGNFHLGREISVHDHRSVNWLFGTTSLVSANGILDAGKFGQYWKFWHSWLHDIGSWFEPICHGHCHHCLLYIIFCCYSWTWSCYCCCKVRFLLHSFLFSLNTYLSLGDRVTSIVFHALLFGWTLCFAWNDELRTCLCWQMDYAMLSISFIHSMPIALFTSDTCISVPSCFYINSDLPAIVGVSVFLIVHFWICIGLRTWSKFSCSFMKHVAMNIHVGDSIVI